MRFPKVTGVLALVLFALALQIPAQDIPGVSEVQHVTFGIPVRIGASLLPAGKYTVHHTIQGTDHVMVFKLANNKGAEVSAKCILFQLGKKADQTRTVYEVDATNERILRELVFRGDSAKHVF